MQKISKEEAVVLSKLFIDEFLPKEKWYRDIQPYMEAIVLFGSVTKGLNRPDSDIDLLIFVPIGIENKYAKGEYLFKFKDREFNIVLRSIERLEKIAKEQTDVFQAELFRNSEIIWEKSDKVRKLINSIQEINNSFVSEKSYEQMEISNLDKFEINPTNEFHILRHFSFVDPEYSKTLIGQKYFYYDYSKNKFVKSIISPEDIDFALQTIGTKFFPNINGIENPKKLLNFIKEKLKLEMVNKNISWTLQEENKTASFTIRYNKKIGDKNLIPISDLSIQEKTKIKTMPRSEHTGEESLLVNTITNVKIQSVDIIAVEIVQTDEFPFYFITAYPKSNQSGKEYGDKQNFWDNYVFVI
ncbi:nucleotidyltransferase domain-containing protein [Candidatus Woesearchaeota archaeon]|jgi:predicted nucleotidyltransferase|nr:nucleotidyltransferase domain-containing protein [Candidatus Woesearchaeota archaeon]MBT4733124.1 nucleotidyltransferase domain-containing protein [Candidatus Woesearchaeota archaeon]MBT7555549.1 nucleotidyltransferase domain-containing protein [Candidatus Woesearchaeota archaeon]